MTEVLASQRAPFAARLLAALVAFELGDDAVGGLLRSAAEEYGLDRVALWPAEGDVDAGAEPDGASAPALVRGPVGTAPAARADGVLNGTALNGTALNGTALNGTLNGTALNGTAVPTLPGQPTGPALDVSPAAARPLGEPARPLSEYVKDPDHLPDHTSAAADHGRQFIAPELIDLPVRFGDLVVGRLLAESPVALDPQLLVPLCDALGLLVGETGPDARADTLARRFEDRRLLIETIMEQLPVGVAVTNTAGVFQLVNHRMSELFGTGLTGMTFGTWSLGAAKLTRLDGSDVGVADLPLVRALHHGETVAPEEFVFHPTGGRELIMTISAAPVLDADGVLLACVVTASDVTESHEAAAEIAEMRAGLALQVRELSRLQRLVDSLSHTDALPEVFAELLEAVGDLLGSHVGVIMVRGADGESSTSLGDVVVAAQRGLTESQVAAIASLEQDELQTTRRAIAGFDAYISDIQSDPRCSPRYRAVSGLLRAVAVHSIPLRAANGRVVGTIASFFDRPYHPTRREMSILRTCAGIGSQLIANSNAREAEHRVAEELQRWMLQQDLPVVPGLELAARYQPATEGMLAGGDWYDVMPLPCGALGLTIGDVVGHGVRAAAEMGQLRSAVRAYALTSGSDPASLLRQVNAFVDATAVGEMTTLGYLAVEPAAAVARWVSAGHSPLLVIGPDGAARFVSEAGLTTPLGVADPDRPVAAEVAFGPGTTLVLYTDGLVERRDRDIDEGLAALRAAAEGFDGTVDELCDRVLAECVPAGERSDDVAVLVLRNRG